MTMVHSKSRPDGEGRAGIHNEDWDDLSLNHHQVGAVVAPPSRVKSLHHTAEPEAAAAAASSLDDYLHKYPSVSDFVLSIPSRKECKQTLPPPAETPSSDNEQKNKDSSCDDSILSDITEMTYRAELMKEVSSERSRVFAFIYVLCSL